jgi:hypothetical protein
MGAFDMSNSTHDVLLRFVTPIVVAGILGVWAFASSRASREELNSLERRTSEDIRSIEESTEDLEGRILVQLENVKDTTTAIQIEQAEFRAELRQMLRPNN